MFYVLFVSDNIYIYYQACLLDHSEESIVLLFYHPTVSSDFVSDSIRNQSTWKYNSYVSISCIQVLEFKASNWKTKTSELLQSHWCCLYVCKIISLRVISCIYHAAYSFWAFIKLHISSFELLLWSWLLGSRYGSTYIETCRIFRVFSVFSSFTYLCKLLRACYEKILWFLDYESTHTCQNFHAYPFQRQQVDLH